MTWQEKKFTWAQSIKYLATVHKKIKDLHVTTNTYDAYAIAFNNKQIVSVNKTLKDVAIEEPQVRLVYSRKRRLWTA